MRERAASLEPLLMRNLLNSLYNQHYIQTSTKYGNTHLNTTLPSCLEHNEDLAVLLYRSEQVALPHLQLDLVTLAVSG